nr:S41 family peptidase [uncultured Psychroserpens sp.]
MRILKEILVLTTILILIFSCKKNEINPEVRNYLITAIDSIQTNALTSSDVDWETVRAKALNDAKGLTKTNETYDIIVSVLGKLDDNHSFLQKNNANLSYANNKGNKRRSPYGSRMQIEYGLHQREGKTFARIFVPQGLRDNTFAQSLQDRLFEMQQSNPCGWVVDLRGNGGGNMWPMLAGVGPLVGDNPLGGGQKGNGETDGYLYDNGKAIYVDFNGNKKLLAEATERIEILSDDIPVAFLIDRGTGSSGEAMAVIFKGRKNTKAFGEKTYGASTSTRGIKLSDSLNIVLAVATFQDRNKNIYLNGVAPDVEIPIGDEMELPEDDPVINEALNWLMENCE